MTASTLRIWGVQDDALSLDLTQDLEARRPDCASGTSRRPRAVEHVLYVFESEATA